MEDTATVDTGTAVDAQSTETESAPSEAPVTQAAETASAPSLKTLLKREKDNPNVKFTDAELDVLEAHYEKQDQPKSAKTKAPKEEPEEDEPDEKPVTKTKEEPEEPEEEPEAEDDADDGEDPEAKAILKEVGAKSLKDAAAKIKQLKSLVGGKDAQAVARVTKEKDELMQSGRSLWAALAKEEPAAIAFVEKNFGVKWGGKAQAQVNPQQQVVAPGNRFIDPDKFIDPDSAALVESALQRQAQEFEGKIKAISEKFGVIEQERDRIVQESAKESSQSRVIEEMADLAQLIPEMKAIPGFKEAARKVLNGEADPRLDVFSELFEIAKGIKGATLKDAFYIKRGKDSDRIVAVAKQEGRKEAYNVKPNPSLSGMTGGKGEASYQPVTPAQLEKWESDHTTHPASWYNKEGDLVQSKIPRAAWKIFDLK